MFNEQQVSEYKKYYLSKDKENIERILSFAEIVNKFYDENKKQRIRSNIFLKDSTYRGYQIYAQYNMSLDPDHRVNIPINKGVTGEAWLTKSQVWANHDQIYRGVHRLTIVDRENPCKLQWICSTPIIKTDSNGNSETIAVFNIDGNKAVDDEALKERIQETGIIIVHILERYNLDCLREPSVAN